MNINSILQEKQSVTAIYRLVEEILRDVRTISLGYIVSFNKDTQKADIKLLQKDFIGEDIEEIDILKDVPVLNYGILSIFTTLPIQSGDLGVLLFSDRSIDEIDEGFKEVRDNRTHDISDGLFIPLPIRFGDEIIKDYDKDCFEIRNKKQEELFFKFCPKTKEIKAGFVKDKLTFHIKKDLVELLTNDEKTKISITKDKVIISINGSEKIEVSENEIILKENTTIQKNVTIDGNLTVNGVTDLKTTTINGITQTGN